MTSGQNIYLIPSENNDRWIKYSFWPTMHRRRAYLASTSHHKWFSRDGLSKEVISFLEFRQMWKQMVPSILVENIQFLSKIGFKENYVTKLPRLTEESPE
jgi:hypothetical protein